jgi:hypothetical protein
VWDVLHARAIATGAGEHIASLTTLCWTHPLAHTVACGYADGSVRHYCMPGSDVGKALHDLRCLGLLLAALPQTAGHPGVGECRSDG